MARTSYTPEVKAMVMAALLEGQSIPKVAEKYKIPRGTVSTWKKTLRATLSADATQKGETSLDNLLLGYVSENLVTLREQAKFFRNPDWLKHQEASELAVLHGVLTDKSIRLLELFGRQEET